jgi:hypothetical protein
MSAFLEYRPSQTLFKYCSAEGFFGIVKAKRLWFSDLSSTNDPRELRLGYEHFTEALESVRRNECGGERGSFLVTLAQHLASYHERQQAFCCCFSAAGDELPMWGAYGANYGGVAMGFRPTAVFDIPARVQKVRYINENTPDDFRRLVLEIAAQFDATRKPDDFNYWIPATAAAWAAMTALKHTTWGYEQEVRMVHMQTIRPPDNFDDIFSVTSFLPSGRPVRWTKPLERLSEAKNISYLEFPFGRFRDGAFYPEGAIEKVIIGPRCSLSHEDVTVAMQEHGFENFKVTRSICEIR